MIPKLSLYCFFGSSSSMDEIIHNKTFDLKLKIIITTTAKNLFPFLYFFQIKKKKNKTNDDYQQKNFQFFSNLIQFQHNVLFKQQHSCFFLSMFSKGRIIIFRHSCIILSFTNNNTH